MKKEDDMDDTLRLILERLTGLDEAVKSNARERREEIAHLHGKVDALAADLAQIKGRLSITPTPGESAICKEHREAVQTIGQRISGLAKEVDDLKRNKWTVLGGAAVLLFLFNVLWPFLSKHFFHGP